MLKEKRDNKNTTLTAWTIAHRRTFTDISYSQAIFDEIEKLRHLQKVKIHAEFKSPEIAPQIEARYKLVSRLLEENHIEQVLEIAAGFSPRGLGMTKNLNTTYVEVDLPDIMTEKKKIVDIIGSRKNLHLVNGSALDIDSLRASTKYFNRIKQLGVVHEGLLRYLTFGQKKIVARNIHTLLDNFGGVWITPDITLKTVVKSEDIVARNKIEKMHKLIGINIAHNFFENVDEAQSFFENLNFSVERHRFLEVIDELTSPNKLGQTRKDVEALIGEAHVFVMRVKGSRLK